MKLINLFKLSVMNVTQKRTRFILIGFGVSISIGTLVLLVSLGGGVQKKLVDSISSSGEVSAIDVVALKSDAANKNTPSPTDLREFTKDELASISQIKDVKLTYSEQSAAGEIDYMGKKTEGLIVSQPAVVKVKLLAGSGFNFDDEKSIILNTKNISEIGLTQDQAIGKEVEVKTYYVSQDAPTADEIRNNVPPKKYSNSYMLKIVGVKEYSLFDTVQIIVPQGLASGLIVKGPDNNLAGLKVVVSDTTKIKDVQKDLNSLGFKTSTQQDAIDSINNTFFFLKSALASFGVVALIVSIFGVISFMLISVYERMKEIGILRALGMSRTDIAKMFLMEAGYMGFAAGLLGLAWSYLVGLAIAALVNHSLANVGPNLANFGFKPEFDLGVVLLGMITAILTTVIATIYPAIVASSQDIAKILKNE